MPLPEGFVPDQNSPPATDAQRAAASLQFDAQYGSEGTATAQDKARVKQQNIQSIRAELTRTKDPKARKVLMDELSRVQAGLPSGFTPDSSGVEVEPAYRNQIVNGVDVSSINPANDPVTRGVNKGLVNLAGTILDAPQNVIDLARAGLGYANDKINKPGAEELPVIGPRVASTALRSAVNRVLPLESPENMSRGDQAKETAGEMLAYGLAGGRPTNPNQVLYNFLLPMIGGVAGQQLAGDKGKMIGSIGLPVAAWGAGALTRLGLGGPSENVQALQDVGVPPMAANVSNSGAVVQSVLGKTPAGAMINRRAVAAQNEAIGNKLDQLTIEKEVMPSEAGDVIGQGLKNWKDRFYQTYRGLQQKTQEAFPDSVRIKPKGFQATVENLITPTKGGESSTVQFIPQDLLDIASNLKADLERNGGWISAGALRQLKSDIGNIAFPKSGLITQDRDTAKYERLYKALASDLEAASKQISPAAYAAQKAENTYYAQGAQQVREYFNALTDKIGDGQKVFDGLVAGTKRGAEQVKAVTEALTQSERDTVASAMIEQLGNVRANRRQQGGFNADEFAAQWDNMNPAAKRALFGGTSNPEMLNDLDRIAKAANVIKSTKDVLPNPSGSAQGVAGLMQGATVFGGLWGILTGVVAPTAASALLASPKFASWLAKTITLPDGPQTFAHLARLNAIAAESNDKDFQQAAKAYIGAVEQGAAPVQPATRRGKTDAQGITPPIATKPIRAYQ